jgi:Chaperone of endosialidase
VIMTRTDRKVGACHAVLIGLLAWCTGASIAAGAAADISVLTSAQPSALLSVDQNRNSVIERIVAQWGVPLEQSRAGLTRDQLRTMLQGLRADHLLAASLAGSLPGLRDVLANSLTTTATATSTRVHIKAVGDVADDLVYTPVSPCRLFDSRPAQGGLGVLNPNVRRTYGATTPVTNQGGPGGCVAPAGAAVALIQIGTLTPAGFGYVQGGAQGVATFPNALILYQSGDQYGTSVAMPLNVTNGRFDVQVQGSATDLYGDLLGYFQTPKNYGGTHVITGVNATDSGGYTNTATGNYSTVGGGADNFATGAWSTVPGGSINVAGGHGSFAAGIGANAVANGCFVFGDFTATSSAVTCNSANQFMVRSRGGVFFFTGGNSDATYTGAQLAPGATAWTTYSDRAGKDNVQRIDALAVLSKVAAMPIATWNWKSQDASIRHMGPMAQDFHAAFGLGETDKGISTVDADGVALAAIQGLNEKLESTLADRDRELAIMAAKVGALEAALAELLTRSTIVAK